MGIFLDKIVKPLFRSQKGNWVSRINELIDSQLKIAHSGQTKQEKEGDRMAFVNALDGLVDYIDNYDVLMESVSEFYVKFDIKSAKPLHNKALKNPEKFMQILKNNIDKNPKVTVIISTANIGFIVIRLMLLFVHVLLKMIPDCTAPAHKNILLLFFFILSVESSKKTILSILEFLTLK